MKKNILVKTLILSYLITFLTNASLYAQPGTLDPSFGTDGFVITDIDENSDEINSIALQKDGKIIVGGTSGVDFALARYNGDGTIDSTFGINGIIITDIDSKDQKLVDIKIQKDEKIIAAGYHLNNSRNADILLARYNSNGSLDSTFGNQGLSIISFDLSEYPNSLSLQNDGKIIIAGFTTINNIKTFMLVRCNIDGSIDNTFNGNGIVTTNIEYNNQIYDSKAFDVEIQPDEKIVAGGFALSPKGQTDFALVRYNQDGSLDDSFNNGGIITTQISNSSDCIKRITIDSYDNIICAGYTYINMIPNIAIVKYKNDGSYDTAFGSNGITTFQFGTASSIIIQPDGKFVTAGKFFQDGNWVFALARFTEKGIIDESFGVQGKVTNCFGANIDEINSMLIQKDGLIVVGGSTYDGVNKDFILARYLSGVEVKTSNIKYDNELRIFPNPIINKMYFNISIADCTIKIYDLFGKRILSRQVISNSVDLSDLNKGIYLLEINYDNKLFLKKIFKE